jgi:hypothetical protein
MKRLCSSVTRQPPAGAASCGHAIIVSSSVLCVIVQLCLVITFVKFAQYNMLYSLIVASFTVHKFNTVYAAAKRSVSQDFILRSHWKGIFKRMNGRYESIIYKALIAFYCVISHAIVASQAGVALQ